MSSKKNQPSAKTLLSIIIVNWNGGNVLMDCLESIYKNPPSFMFEVILLDNCSSDGSQEQAKEMYPQVHFIQSEKNLGFAQGNNQALERASGDFILLLNNDTLVLEDALERLVTEACVDPDVGIWGLKIINPDGSLQRSFGIYPNILTEFLDQTMLHRFFPVSKMGNWDSDHPRDVDWVTGACLLIRRETYEDIGGFDPQYYMFLEDVDLCFRAKRAGWRVRYTPSARIIHIKGFSSQTIMRRMLVEDQRSTYHFVREHYSRFTVWGFKLSASFGAVVRSTYWAIKGLFGYRDEAVNRIKAYGEILIRSWIDPEFVWGEERYIK